MASSAKVADSQELERLVQEQAALRRIAMLVAGGAPSTEVFDAVAKEVVQVLDLSNAAVCKYDDDGTAVDVLAVCGDYPAVFAKGSRWPLDGPSLSATVLRTGRAGRVEDYTDLEGSLATAAREHGFGMVVGAPILADGRVWGVILTSSPDLPLPDDLEDRLTEFTELVGTAIGNSQAQDELARIADEQAALTRVATLVAQGAAPANVFAAVSTEVARLVPADASALARFEADGTVTSLAGWTSSGGYVYSGRRFALEGTVSGLVFESGRPARIDYDHAPGAAAAAAREMGWRSSVAAPITIDGRLWGALAVVSKRDTALPSEMERRLSQFTNLVATAISNSDAHEALAQLADEQAALRRVATLVAEGARPNDVFAGVADEVAAMFGVPVAMMLRYDADRMATVLATAGAEFAPVGSRVPVELPSLCALVFESGESARIEDWAALPGCSPPAPENGIHWAVGVPIVVNGALWGVIATASGDEALEAAHVEERLTKFTELLATAVANSEAHEQLARLADEQASLRRVATLVAEGATPYRVFDAVRDEVARVFNVPLTVLMRYDTDGMATVLATANGYLGPVGRRWPVHEDDISALARVRHTGRAVRVDYTAARTHGAIAESARKEGARTAIGVPVEVDGALWGVMAAGSREPDPLPSGIESRLVKFTQLLATAIANAESRAELEASRARIVATADATRRRIERDLHDGAQQQIVSLALELRAAQATVPASFAEHRSELSHVVEGLTGVLDDLREIALGIHPAGLSEGGLRPALKTLARRSAVPVSLDLDLAAARLPEAVEVTAYYVVSEALANAAKYAGASGVDVAVAADEGVLRVDVRDEGRGGADPARGSGLVGLRDRVEATGGTMRLTSPPGSGTTLNVVLPLGDTTASG